MPLNLETVQALRSDALGYFRFKKLDAETYLLTNETGKWAFMPAAQFGPFLAGKADDSRRAELLQKGFLKSPDFEKRAPKAYAQRNLFLASGPTLHIVVTTLRCNHKCQYCHAAVAPMTATGLDMTTETAEKVLDTVFHSSAQDLTIEFQGGESLVNWPVVKWLVEGGEKRAAVLKKRVTFALVSNLSLMDEEKFAYLMDHGVQISTSLDGDEETHNFNRTFKSGNSFAETAKWILRFNEEYKRRGMPVKVGALMTTTRKSLSRHKEIIDAYANLGLDGVFLRTLNPYGFAAADLKNLGYSTEEFLEFYHKSFDYILEKNRAGTYFRERMAALYLLKILTPTDPNYLDERSPCGACVGQVAYNYDGKLYSCDEGRMLGRMGTEDFLATPMLATGRETYEALVKSETAKVMVQASTLDGLPGFNDDAYKPYIGVCPIHSFKTTGNIYPTWAKDERRKVGDSILDRLFLGLKDPDMRALLEGWISDGKPRPSSDCPSA